MASGKILVRVVDGARQPFAGDVFVSLFDGAQRRVHAAFHPKPNIEFTIPVTNGPMDSYRVVVGAKDHADAAQTAIRVLAASTTTVHMMLIPKRPVPRFRAFGELSAVHPQVVPLLEAFLRATFGSASEDTYAQLQRENPAGLMTFFSIASAFADFATRHPLDFVEALDSLQQDRFFARVRVDLMAFLTERPQIFKDALSLLHPGAFKSFKESRYPEGNVQFTFKKIENVTDMLTLDSDIDLFADTASHIVVEFLPNDVFNPPSKTDPRRAYAMRWMAVERQRSVDPGTAAFDPPFELVKG